MNEIDPTTELAVSPDARSGFIEACELISERIGHKPDPEFLMSLMIEAAPEPRELAETFCATIWRHMAPITESA